MLRELTAIAVMHADSAVSVADEVGMVALDLEVVDRVTLRSVTPRQARDD